MSDWIEWKGGQCPVEYGTPVEIRLRCDELNSGEAGIFGWTHGIPHFAYEGDDDIMAYRIIKD